MELFHKENTKASELFSGKKHCAHRQKRKFIELPRLIGHRGTGKNTENSVREIRENTIASTNNLLEILQGEREIWCEIDVQITQDKIPVVYHNMSINTSSGTLLVLDCTYAELVEHEKYNSLRYKVYESPPTLSHFLEHIDARINVIIEIKYNCEYFSRNCEKENISEYTQIILDAVQNACRNSTKKIVYFSFSEEICCELLPKTDCPIYLLLDYCGTHSKNDIYDMFASTVERVKKKKLSGISCHSQCVLSNPRIIEIFKKHTFNIITYHNSKKETIEKQEKIGITNFIVDFTQAD